MQKHLTRIGFSETVLELVPAGSLERFDLARVVAVHKESCIVSDGAREVPAELVGKLAFGASSPLDFPAVGDWVLVNIYDEGSLAIIHEILPRKTLLKRKAPGKKVDFQLIAANIDRAFIVQSLNENFNLRRLERYLVMVNESEIEPIVLLSKSDLLDADEIAGKVAEILQLMPGLQVESFSNTEDNGLDRVRELMRPGQTCCLLGSSGVGKTSLINNLVGEDLYKTLSVSQMESKGRHATTHRQLVRLASGALIVDTPGMRELGNLGIETGLDATFAEIAELAASCRFSDCSHVAEKGCAVRAAVEGGELAAERYQNYLKMTRETAYNEMSYLEKRQKDRDFGKMVKSAMKHKKNRR